MADVRIRNAIVVLLALAGVCFGFGPEHVLIVVNGDIEQSVAVGRYYSESRQIEHILELSLGSELADDISRQDYESKVAEPVRRALSEEPLKGRIRCVVTVYGVPYRVGGLGPCENWLEKVQPLRKMRTQGRQMLESLEGSRRKQDIEQRRRIETQLWRIQSEIDRLQGRQTGASLDSELSMVMHEPYELFRWQPNELRGDLDFDSTDTIMVSRLDGPGADIARGLVDKALIAQATGPRGHVYVDSRGIADDEQPGSFGQYDQSLRDMAELFRRRTPRLVIEEKTERLFQPGKCPQAAFYCGWYSLTEYIPAFEFVTGAVGYHIASFEAIDIRDPQSTQWVSSMLREGITATMGAVAEPYLHAFPLPDEFFAALLDGDSLAEAYYRTKPFNSWQMVLIGDPLYRPFRRR